MSATVKDIALKCGLSVATVIQVLGDQGHRYRAETRERVLAAARELGYRRNSSARAMRRGRFDCVALLMSMEPDSTLLHQSALEGICDALTKHGLHLSVARLPDEALVNEGFVPKMLSEWTADGLLISFAVKIPPRMVELIEASSLPCIWMRSKRPADCVYPDEADAWGWAVRHLAELGHRRIAYADFTYGTQTMGEAHFGFMEGEQGYRAAMLERGLEPRVFREEARVERIDREARFRAILSSAGRPTALCAYPSTAWPAVYAAARLGMRIPGDLSVVTMSGRPEDGMGVPLSTLLTPEYEIGRQAAEMLVERIRNPDSPLPPRRVPFGFAEGDSCAPLPALSG